LEGLIVREVAWEDFHEWTRLWESYNSFYGRSGATRLPEDVTQATWARFFMAEEPVHALVAQMAGEIVGLAHYLFHRSTISVASTCYLQDLFTADEARGRGVATALISQVCEKARSAGSPRVYWQTHETNERARRLYDSIGERSGFIVYRVRL
jgi:GNAT superfamily N-acetyltransferase